MLVVEPDKLDRLLDHARRQTAAGAGGPVRLSDAEQELLHRARLLPDRDRWIVELVYRHHVPVRRVGEVLGLAAGNVSRAARRAWRRLNDPMTRDLARPALPLAPETRDIAIEHFVTGRSIRAIAQARGLTTQQVKALVHYARGFLRAAAQRRALP